MDKPLHFARNRKLCRMMRDARGHYIEHYHFGLRDWVLEDYITDEEAAKYIAAEGRELAAEDALLRRALSHSR